MKIELVTYRDLGSMYVVYPDGPRISCYENTLLTVLREDTGRESVEKLLDSAELRERPAAHPDAVPQPQKWSLGYKAGQKASGRDADGDGHGDEIQFPLRGKRSLPVS